MIMHTQKSIYFLFLFFTMLGGAFQAQDVEGYDKMTEELLSGSVKLISIDSLNSLDLESIFLLDTREEEEFEVSHIPGSRYVGFNWFKMKSVRDIPKDATIITYCSVGYRSEKMGERLMRAGYSKVYNLQGGIFSWANNGGTLINDSEEKTTAVHGYDSDWSQWLNKNKCKVELE